jgi:hypothetical protein
MAFVNYLFEEFNEAIAELNNYTAQIATKRAGGAGE